MAKGYKIVTGTADEVSNEVTRLQNEGWLLKGDFQPLTPLEDDNNPREFAQTVILSEKEVDLNSPDPELAGREVDRLRSKQLRGD